MHANINLTVTYSCRPEKKQVTPFFKIRPHGKKNKASCAKMVGGMRRCKAATRRATGHEQMNMIHEHFIIAGPRTIEPNLYKRTTELIGDNNGENEKNYPRPNAPAKIHSAEKKKKKIQGYPCIGFAPPGINVVEKAVCPTVVDL